MKFNRRREEDKIRKLKEKEEVDWDNALILPEDEVEELMEESTKSLIVRILNVDAIKAFVVTVALLKIWGVEKTVRGRGIGIGRVQFIFQHEFELLRILNSGPWHINGWLTTGARWCQDPPKDFLEEMLVWVSIRGFPIHLSSQKNVEAFANTIGMVETTELHAKDSTSVDYLRERIWIKISEPVLFKKVVKDKKGISFLIDLDYEKVSKLCLSCQRMTHVFRHCKFKRFMSGRESSDSAEPSVAFKGAGLSKGKSNKKVLQSSKGVVISKNTQKGGSSSGPKKDSKSHQYLKGKGKMPETSDARGDYLEDLLREKREQEKGDPTFYNMGRKQRRKLKPKTGPIWREIRRERRESPTEEKDRVGITRAMKRKALAEKDRAAKEKEKEKDKEDEKEQAADSGKLRAPGLQRLSSSPLALEPSNLRFQLGCSDTTIHSESKKRRQGSLSRLSTDCKKRRVEGGSSSGTLSPR